MRLFSKQHIKIILFFVLVILSINITAQCKRFTKKNCFPLLAPYIHNGQLTTTYMIPGDTADVLMTFNAGKNYRILTCSQELIGHVQFNVLDNKRKLLYQSKLGEINPSWDFKVTHTQQFIIQITIPKKEKSRLQTNIVANGCVSLLVGFKE